MNYKYYLIEVVELLFMLLAGFALASFLVLFLRYMGWWSI
jgi:hypothetical protein